MNKHRPWQPRIKNAPLFNPFEPSTEWTAQLGADDRIQLEEEEDTAEQDPAPAQPTTEKPGEK